MKTTISTFLQLLCEAGYTQEEIAEKIGVSGPTINRYLAGKINPTVETLCKIADAFSVSTDAVLGREPATIIKNVRKPWERKKASCNASTSMN